jgi:uncharacterized membrane protein YfcA
VSPVEAAAILTLVFAASAVQTATGLGFGLLIVPPLVLVIGVKDAVVVSNVLSTVVSSLLLVAIHGSVSWPTASRLFIAACVGMPFGLLVLIVADARVLQIVVAAGVILFTLLLARGVRIRAPGWQGDAATGLVSGVLRTSTSMSGPPVIIVLQGRGTEAAIFRGTITAYFVASGVVGIGLLAAGGRFNADVLWDVAIGVPAVLAGLAAGSVLYRRFDETLFRRAVLAILLVSATVALVTALFA